MTFYIKWICLKINTSSVFDCENTSVFQEITFNVFS